jgi:multidrug transporter EmrE-like cation transporter
MTVINYTTIGFGVFLALLDVVAFPFVKYVSLGSKVKWMAIPVILYAISPFILLESIKAESLAVMNLLWDTISTVFITILCIFVFKENISSTKLIGMVLSLFSILLMSYEN